MIKTYLHGPMDYAKKLKLRFRVGDLDLPERRKRYTSSRKEEDVATSMCPCGATREQDPYSRRMYNTQGGTGCVRGDEEIRRM